MNRSSPSIETRQKISKSLTGRKQSLETIEKRAAKLRKPHSLEWNRKISEAHKGKKLSYSVWNKGKRGLQRMSEVTRAKMRLSAKRGQDNHMWKGGRETERTRRSFQECRRRAARVKNGGTHTLEQWELLEKEYGYMCLCCKKIEPEIKLTEDHIIPITRGGGDDITNIQPLCLSCNVSKFQRIICYLCPAKYLGLEATDPQVSV